MDATNEDQDVLLQRTSPELLADFQNSLLTFLWRTKQSGKMEIRDKVRVKETDRLVNLLEPFQELPQLLDPHLDKFVPVLAQAFLEYLRKQSVAITSPSSRLLTPLSKAISRLLYTFCKIRGEKVIVRFLSTEMRHLELLLTAIECAQIEVGDTHTGPVWDWEERYITLLWLSQLLLAPFDLSTISSVDVESTTQPHTDGLAWPSNTPGIAIRVISLAILHLSSSGKERDAAKSLLVRISMRRDMQEIGILRMLVHWSLSCLKTSTNQHKSAYLHLGMLSFLSGLLSSSTSTKDMHQYLTPICETVQTISSDGTAFKELHSLALARKIIIKVLRALSIIVLQVPANMEGSDIVETTISSLLESLSDPATPVRLAASKALSMITLKLEPDFAAQVIEVVLESLQVNVTWNNTTSSVKPDLSRVNPYEWHGLILTLSHLLYRRSPPPTTLADILSALFLGLCFEQKSTTGASVGTNVRDAACFGIWALARRYTTLELQNFRLNRDSTPPNSEDAREVTTLQQLASLLVVSACLDPAGNIRRGSSAALQELIGRHPDAIAEGISVVQVVDYHAIALRSRAVRDVAIQVAHLSDHYHSSLTENLLGWRGVRDPNSQVREDCAFTFGALTWAKANTLSSATHRVQLLSSALMDVFDVLKSLELRDTETRHGLLLCLSSVLDHMLPDFFVMQEYSGKKGEGEQTEAFTTTIIAKMTELFSDLTQNFQKFRSPELIASAAGRLILASYPAARKDCVVQYETQVLCSSYPGAMGASQGQTEDSSRGGPFELLFLGPSLRVGSATFDAQTVLDDIETIYRANQNELRMENYLELVEDLLKKCLQLKHKECVDSVADATADLCLLMRPSKRKSLYTSILHGVRSTGRPNTPLGLSYLHTLFRILPIISTRHEDLEDALSTLKERWISGRPIENRVAFLVCLSRCLDLQRYLPEFLDIIVEGLDDYTTDARGDIGSLLRIEALKVVRALWELDEKTVLLGSETMKKLYPRVLRLAAEKLDKVRAEGQSALSALLSHPERSDDFKALSTASPQYFTFLLSLATPQTSFLLKKIPSQENPDQYGALLSSLLMGYITSADTGSEDLVRSSRIALSSFCESEGHRSAVFRLLSIIIKKNEGEDRIVVPALEVLGFLYDVGAWEGIGVNEVKLLFLRTQKAHFKTANVKKLDVAIKIYGSIIRTLQIPPDHASAATNAPDADELSKKVMDKLTSMLSHPFPRVREKVIEELWVSYGVGKSIDVSKKGLSKKEISEILARDS